MSGSRKYYWFCLISLMLPLALNGLVAGELITTTGPNTISFYLDDKPPTISDLFVTIVWPAVYSLLFLLGTVVFVINPRSESVFKIFSLLSLAVFVAVGSYYLWKLGFWKNGNILWTLISIWGLTNAWFYQKKYVH